MGRRKRSARSRGADERQTVTVTVFRSPCDRSASAARLRPLSKASRLDLHQDNTPPLGSSEGALVRAIIVRALLQQESDQWRPRSGEGQQSVAHGALDAAAARPRLRETPAPFGTIVRRRTRSKAGGSAPKRLVAFKSCCATRTFSRCVYLQTQDEALVRILRTFNQEG
jgi:hypothetical protein